MIIYVEWEGRGYQNDDLRRDLLNVRAKLGSGPLYSAGYDVGVLVTNQMPPDFTQVMFTRGGCLGEHEDWTQPDQDGNDPPDDLPLANGWTLHRSIADMLWDWFEKEWILS